MIESGREAFSLSEGVLLCPSDMNPVPPTVFRTWCDSLLNASSDEIVIDMRATRYILSQHVGIMANAWSDAVAAGKRLTVRASPEVRVVLDATGLSSVLDVSGE